ncbi:DUF488 domain-containing protein [Cellulomonas iranensis]|uniref:DUF488 domain-containing protein n=1 Tax=Cellulomonas iranensis TaxID=76862 RepID=UPI003D7E8A70
MAARLVTFGHGTLAQEEVAHVLRGADVRHVVDVRRFPGSRRHPHVAREALAAWLPAAGVDCRWEERLGGRRRRAADDDLDTWWQVDAFRAYAAYARTDVFGAALADLLGQVRTVDGEVAVMCSEAVWWRCHRRVVADAAVLLHGVDVRHLGHDGRLTPHPPAAGARVTPRGLVYDAPREPA